MRIAPHPVAADNQRGDGRAFRTAKRVRPWHPVDFRESQDRGVNVVIAGACTTLLREMSFGEDVTQLAKDLAGKIVAALKRT